MPKTQRPAKRPVTPKPSAASPRPAAAQKHYTRFSLIDRIEHVVFILTFTLLALTGLPQKFSAAPISEGIIAAFGGIDRIRVWHHGLAIVLMAQSIFHIITVSYRAIVMRRPLSMLPVVEDFRHLGQNLAYVFGRRKERPRFGRYSYEEKVEYLAVVWGMLIMIVTGFFMWNPIATTRALPGEVIPAAKVAHGAEAVLAVLAIILWHFYNVHLKHFNTSMFTGKMSEAEMLHEHPEELAQIKAGMWQPPEGPQVQQRQRIFLPIAAVLAALLSLGLYQFVTFEETAITTLPPRETVEAFSPQTPTPSPQPSPTAFPIAQLTWNALVGPLLAERCGECHGSDGGLSLATYSDALAGGASGAAIVPGEADSSLLVAHQARGDHPGQLSGEELALVREWIEAGAAEK
jgi:cytochrome b subunit of formate dehydrogenase